MIKTCAISHNVNKPIKETVNVAKLTYFTIEINGIENRFPLLKILNIFNFSYFPYILKERIPCYCSFVFFLHGSLFNYKMWYENFCPLIYCSSEIGSHLFLNRIPLSTLTLKDAQITVLLEAEFSHLTGSPLQLNWFYIFHLKKHIQRVQLFTEPFTVAAYLKKREVLVRTNIFSSFWFMNPNFIYLAAKIPRKILISGLENNQTNTTRPRLDPNQTK